MIRQSDPAMPAEVQIFGCYFCSVLYLAEMRTGKVFDADRVMAIYKAAKRSGILGEECYVAKPVDLFALAGVNLRDVVKADNNVIPGPGGFELLHFHRAANTPAGMKNKMHDHFVAGDGHGQVAFDPLGQSLTVRWGYLQNKRIFL